MNALVCGKGEMGITPFEENERLLWNINEANKFMEMMSENSLVVTGRDLHLCAGR